MLFRSSPPSPIISHHPLRHIPAVTDFGLVISREPAPAPPQTKPFVWRTYNSSSNSSRRGKSTCRTISRPLPMLRLHQWRWHARRWSPILAHTMAPLPSSTNGGARSRSGCRSQCRGQQMLKTAAIYSRLTGPKAGRWAQVRLDHCMAVAHALAAAPAGHNLPAA